MIGTGMPAGALTASYLMVLISGAYALLIAKKEKKLPEVVERENDVADGEAGTKIPGPLQVVHRLQLQPELLCQDQGGQSRERLLERCRRPWLP